MPTIRPHYRHTPIQSRTYTVVVISINRVWPWYWVGPRHSPPSTPSAGTTPLERRHHRVLRPRNQDGMHIKKAFPPKHPGRRLVIIFIITLSGRGIAVDMEVGSPTFDTNTPNQVGRVKVTSLGSSLALRVPCSGWSPRVALFAQLLLSVYGEDARMSRWLANWSPRTIQLSRTGRHTRQGCQNIIFKY